VSSADLSRLTAIVHTCDRPHSIERLVRSIGWLHPQLRILVADDSRKPQEIAGADIIRLPADVGVSAARNALLARVRTPYFLLLEDDFELSRRSGIGRLLDLVAQNQVDIAAGELIRCQRRFGLFTRRTPEPAHAKFEFEADALKLIPATTASRAVSSASGGVNPPGRGPITCDVAHNFFVGRVDKVRAIGGWDPQLQVDERIEFFFRACRYGLRVGVCQESVAWRWTEKRADRRTARDFTSLAVAKMGVSRMMDADGRLHEAAPSRRAA
jgi:hypothetical protein